MGKKPNYRADRIERERTKAAKKAKRMEAKVSKSGRQQPEDLPATEALHDDAGAATDDDEAGE